MKILLVGGTGMIGAHAALHLKSLGHDITLAARNAPRVPPELAALPFIQGSYLDDNFSDNDLAQFDALVFCAGNDIRHIPDDAHEVAHYRFANVEGIPRFFARARDAGIKVAVYLGSFYSQAAPDLIETNYYVRSRYLADEGVRKLNSPTFRVSSLNAPIVVGSIPGLPVPFFDAYIKYALGELDAIPVFAPPGGANCISTRSLSEAIAAALTDGIPGKAYLVGDENLTYQAYLQLYFDAVGRTEKIPVIDAEHPLLPDATLFAGRGRTVFYEPKISDLENLGYRRNDIRTAVNDLVSDYQARQSRVFTRAAF